MEPFNNIELECVMDCSQGDCALFRVETPVRILWYDEDAEAHEDIPWTYNYVWCYTAFQRILVDQNETRMMNAMVELEPVVWNFTLKLDNGTRANETTAGYPADEYYNIVHVTETKILPAFIGFLCSTGLVGNVLVLVTILRWVYRLIRKPFASVFN